MSRPTRRDEFGVAIVCALPLEYNAATLVFDEIWEGQDFGKSLGDYNTYTLGRIGQHNVVLALLEMGKVEAAGATTSLRHSFTAVKLAFLCGICGGVPNPKPNVQVLLGDVVIADRVVEYDYGRQYPDEFVRNTATGGSDVQSREAGSYFRHLKMDHQIDRLHVRIPKAIEALQQKSAANGRPLKYMRPGDDTDILFQANYLHRHQNQSQCVCGEGNICNEAKTASCSDLKCDINYQTARTRIDILQQRKLGVDGDTATTAKPGPRVFFGNVGSGDTVMKSGQHRDKVAQEHDIIAFEMEGAGVWKAIPCIVVKAVCDYADSHKNKEWQAFAAAVAASVTKLILGEYVSAIASAAEQASHPSRSATESTAESGPTFLVPYPENPDFVDRSEVFGKLRELYGHANSDKKAHTRLALYGLGGVGKTQIALAYCYWFQDRFPDAHVFWVHASNIDRFRQAFTEIAQECNIAEHETTGDILTLVKKWLENRRKAGRWLLVIDNADDIEVFFPPSRSNKDPNLSSQNPEAETCVGRFIPNCNHGSVLITTRNKQAGLRLAPGKDNIIEVGCMTETETESLLHSLLSEIEDISSQETSLLSNRLEHLPLAIAQAASFINENSISINEYIKLLDQSDLSLVERLSEPFEAVGRDSETPHALTATWMISFNQIKQQYPLASDALSFASLLDRQGIPKRLIRDYCYDRLEELSSSEDPFEKGNVALQVTKVLGTLLAFSFISKAGDDLFDMHRLVQLTTHKRLIDEKSMDSYANSAIATMYRSYPFSRHKNREKCQKYLPHALAVLGRAQLDEREPRIQAAYINCEVAAHLFSLRFFEDSARYQRRALGARAELLGQEDDRTLESMQNLAEVYRELGQFDEALKLLFRLLEIRERLRGKEDPKTLTANYFLARTYNQQGEYLKAEQLHLQRLEVEKRIMGEEHEHTLSTMHDLALLYFETNRLTESEELSLRLIAASARPLNKQDATIRVLSHVYIAQNRLEEAHILLSKLVEDQTEAFGEDDPSTLRSLQVLADVRGKQGHKMERTQILRRVLEKARRIWGNTSIFTLLGKRSLAAALEGIGDLREAEELRQEHFEGALLAYGDRHNETLSSMHDLACMRRKVGRGEDAARLFEECLEGRKQSLGHMHEDTLFTMHELAYSWTKIGRMEDAAKLFDECIESRKRVLGHGHKLTLSSMHDLAYSWRKLGRVEDAAKLFEECLEGRKQVYGPKAERTLQSMGELAKALWMSGRLEESTKMYEETLEAQRQIFGLANETTLVTMYNLQQGLYSLGRAEEAIKLMREYVEGMRQTWGEDETLTKEAIEKLLKYEERLENSRCEGEDASVSDNASREGSDDESGNEPHVLVLQGSDEDSDSDSEGGSGVLLTESP